MSCLENEFSSLVVAQRAMGDCELQAGDTLMWDCRASRRTA
jgi:hypothetical protein